MVIVGIIANRDSAADTALIAGEGGDAGPLGNRQQVLLEHKVTSKQAPALAPVGHQGHRLAALQSPGAGLLRCGEQSTGLQRSAARLLQYPGEVEAVLAH